MTRVVEYKEIIKYKFIWEGNRIIRFSKGLTYKYWDEHTEECRFGYIKGIPYIHKEGDYNGDLEPLKMVVGVPAYCGERTPNYDWEYWFDEQGNLIEEKRLEKAI